MCRKRVSIANPNPLAHWERGALNAGGVRAKMPIEKMSEIIRRNYRFYGYVQGVGFRYRAARCAEKHGVSGWVRNCSDGSVELEAEGTVEAITDLLDDLENGMFIQIDRCVAKPVPVLGSCAFNIRR